MYVFIFTLFLGGGSTHCNRNEATGKESNEANPVVTLTLAPSMESRVEESFDAGGILSHKDLPLYVFATFKTTGFIPLYTYFKCLPLIPKGTVFLSWRKVGMSVRHHSSERKLKVNNTATSTLIISVSDKPFCSVATAQACTGSREHSEAFSSDDYPKGAHSTAKPSWRWYTYDCL